MDPLTFAGAIGAGLGRLFAAYRNARRAGPGGPPPQFNVMIHHGGYLAPVQAPSGVYTVAPELGSGYLTIDFSPADYGADRLRGDEVVLLFLEDANQPDIDGVLLSDVLAGHFSVRLPPGRYHIQALVVDQSQDRLRAYGIHDNLRVRSGDTVHLTLALTTEGAAELEAELLASMTPQPVLLAPDGQLWPIADIVRIGRAPDCHLIIDDHYVSRYHAELIRLDDESYEIRDLGSANGTYVNGHQIRTGIVTDGDTIQIGEIILSILFA
jgi:hypothetical protein